MRHVPIAGASWRVTLVTGIHARVSFIISEKELLLGSPSIRSSLIRLSLGTPNNYLLLLGQFSVPGQKLKAQHVILGLYPYKGYKVFNLKFKLLILLFHTTKQSKNIVYVKKNYLFIILFGLSKSKFLTFPISI